MIVKQLDLASFKSVRHFAAEIIRDEPRLDVLINNAGIAGIQKRITVDGFEFQMQSNYLGHFLLTNLLLGKFKKNVNVFCLNYFAIRSRKTYPTYDTID